MTWRERERLMRKIITDTLWMAMRYADGRSTYAPAMVNAAIDNALKVGILLRTSSDGIAYAKDGLLGEWDPALGSFKPTWTAEEHVQDVMRGREEWDD